MSSEQFEVTRSCDCGFTGLVEIVASGFPGSGHRHERWECPECGYEHDTEHERDEDWRYYEGREDE